MAAADKYMNEISVAYLISRYPAVSHTFILREVLYLKSLGLRIDVASVNEPVAAPNGLTAEEKEEAEQTFYIKRAGVPGALKSHLHTFFRRPARYLAGLFYAVRLAGADPGKLLYNFFYFVEAVMVGDWMRRNGQTHLHVHFATQAATVGLFAAKVFPIGFSMTVHGPDEFYNVEDFYLAEKVERAGFVCCIGKFARSQLMIASSSDPEKFEIAPLGVDPSRFRPKTVRKEPKPFEILCVGRLVPVKGQKILLRAFRELASSVREDVRLRFVGDGDERKSLEEFVRENGLEEKVFFEGAVNQDEIRTCYERADIFVLASFAEGIPVVLMEAMASEVPCVATRITGIPELIRDRIDGLLVPASDVDALTAAIATLVEDAPLRRELGRAGRRRILEKFDFERNTRHLAEIFQRRLGGRNLKSVGAETALPETKQTVGEPGR
jgi:colanic acid/amylovoran biosynthesis glycosyltransferase